MDKVGIAYGSNHAPHRAHSKRATHAFFVFTWLKTFGLQWSVRVWNVFPFHHLPSLAPSPTTPASLLCPSASPCTATSQGGSCFGRNTPLSLVLSPSLSSKSAANTPRSTPKKGQSRTSTISRPLWMRLKCSTPRTWDG